MIQKIQDRCAIGRSPKVIPSGDEFSPAHEILREKLQETLGNINPLGGAWTKRDIEGLLSDPGRLEQAIRRTLIDLAPACPIVVKDVAIEHNSHSLERMLGELKIECRVFPGGFTDECFGNTKRATVLTFTSPVQFQQLTGVKGVVEQFRYWPATLRETLWVLSQHEKVFRLGNFAICGSTSRRELNCFPYLSYSGLGSTLKRENGSTRLWPEKDYIVAFAKEN